MKHDAISVTAVLLFAAFAVERVTSGVLFLLSFSKRWDEFFNPQKSVAAARRSKLAYFILAGTLVLVVLLLAPEMRALRALDVNTPESLDLFLTWLLLVAGADRIASLLPAAKGTAESGAETSKPLQIEGEVTLLDPKEKKPATAGH
jgi:hypothetical protein